MSDSTKTKNGRPVGRRDGKQKKPVVGAQISEAEKRRLDNLCESAGRSQSDIVRGAILYLFKGIESGAVNAADNPENW